MHDRTDMRRRMGAFDHLAGKAYSWIERGARVFSSLPRSAASPDNANLPTNSVTNEDATRALKALYTAAGDTGGMAPPSDQIATMGNVLEKLIDEGYSLDDVIKMLESTARGDAPAAMRAACAAMRGVQ